MKPGAHWWKLALAAGMLAIAADMDRERKAEVQWMLDDILRAVHQTLTQTETMAMIREKIRAELRPQTASVVHPLPPVVPVNEARRAANAFDARGRPVQWLHGLYRPDRYQYEMQLSRVGSIDAKLWVSDELSAQFH